MRPIFGVKKPLAITFKRREVSLLDPIFSFIPDESFSLKPQSILLKEYNDTLKLEEDYWKFCSRINWIRDGDASTRFYHLSISNRRRRNNMSFFKDENDNWIASRKKFVEHALSYYESCFTTDHFATY